MRQNTKENIKIIAALLLLIAIFAGSFVVVWQIREKNRPKSQAKNTDELQTQVGELNKKIDELSKAINDAKEQVSVESSVTVSKSTKQVAGASTQKSANQAQNESDLINLNSATAAELDALDGIGATYAQRIIDYREANGGFKSIEEIKNVKGIGDKTFEKFKDKITI